MPEHAGCFSLLAGGCGGSIIPLLILFLFQTIGKEKKYKIRYSTKEKMIDLGICAIVSTIFCAFVILFSSNTSSSQIFSPLSIIFIFVGIWLIVYLVIKRRISRKLEDPLREYRSPR
ncbi:MAG TPA: hypothetical protein VFF76_06025 [Holophagaceae bacterium]|jgi:hypothetical protein|nr:hypothetical protein [Holophagaceae bacterium]